MAEGDLVATSVGSKEDEKAKTDLEHDCVQKAEDFEAATRSRSDGLTALSEEKRVDSEVRVEPIH